jgi:raffinose/stachyose/melibiose transport system permease protein
VVFPLLKATVMTFTIVNVFWIWNDYLMPQLMLGRRREFYTLQLSMRSLFLEHYAMWDVALAALVLSLIPTVIFFFLAQKNIIEGITAGAIKG